MPGQELRRKNVRRKLNAMALEFAGKNVLIVDDSIVRGTTSKEIIQMARDAGAAKVIMASCAPPIRFVLSSLFSPLFPNLTFSFRRYPNVYGIDMPSRKELVAHGRTEEEISEYIGADLTIFQTLPDLVESCRQFNPKIAQFDCAVFTGEYVTGDIDIKYLEHIEGLRNDAAQKKKNSGSMTTVNGASSSSSSDPVEKNTSNVVRETQPLQDVSGGGEVAGGGDFSNAVGLANEGEQSSMSGSMVMGLANA
jgi:amidophosphoribosyltransferase